MKVKFCGITNLYDAKKAIELGVDYLGFIIDFPRSPRSIGADKFLKLAKEIKSNYKVKIVAVVVDIETEKLDNLISSNLVDIIQFHGNESLEILNRYKGKVEIWRVLSITKYKSKITNYKNFVDRFLMDATSVEEKIKGGYKKFSNFEDFKKLREEGYSLILAGGLNPDNVQEYIEKLNPEIVDVASGIESKPGKKDFVKMEKFMNIVNSYNKNINNKK